MYGKPRSLHESTYSHSHPIVVVAHQVPLENSISRSRNGDKNAEEDTSLDGTDQEQRLLMRPELSTSDIPINNLQTWIAQA